MSCQGFVHIAQVSLALYAMLSFQHGFLCHLDWFFIYPGPLKRTAPGPLKNCKPKIQRLERKNGCFGALFRVPAVSFWKRILSFWGFCVFLKGKLLVRLENCDHPVVASLGGELSIRKNAAKERCQGGKAGNQPGIKILRKQKEMIQM